MDPHIETMKGRAKRMWTKGDYTEIAKLLDPAAEDLVEQSGASAGRAVLDVAAGNGNVAVRAAGKGAHVTACDLTRVMVELGRARSAKEGLSIGWVEADAEDLPFRNESFDVVMSLFGAMFAPRPKVVASELFRVLKPGGSLGMGNWTPTGYMGRSFELTGRYIEQPKGLPRATDWGDEERVIRLLEGLASSIETSRRSLRWRFDSVAKARAFFDRSLGPVLAARSHLSRERFEDMRKEEEALIDQHNVATGGGLAYEPEYLVVIATKPA